MFISIFSLPEGNFKHIYRRLNSVCSDESKAREGAAFDDKSQLYNAHVFLRIPLLLLAMAVDKAEGEEGWWMLSLKAAPCPALVRCSTSSGISASVAFFQTPLQSWRKTGKKNEKNAFKG